MAWGQNWSFLAHPLTCPVQRPPCLYFPSPRCSTWEDWGRGEGQQKARRGARQGSLLRYGQENDALQQAHVLNIWLQHKLRKQEVKQFLGQSHTVTAPGGSRELRCLRDCRPPCSTQNGPNMKPQSPLRVRSLVSLPDHLGMPMYPELRNYIFTLFHKLYIADFCKTLCDLKINLERRYYSYTIFVLYQQGQDNEVV